MSNFYPLEVVGRNSETQIQVGENLNWVTENNNLHYTCNLIITFIIFFLNCYFL